MKLAHILLGGGIVSCMATAAPVPILNFSGEVNSGLDFSSFYPLMSLQPNILRLPSFSA